MYSLSQIRTGLYRPHLAVPELIKKYNHINKDYNTDGINIFDEDWDTLVVLDACRYDLFKQVNPLEGQLHRFHSRGCHTGEFVQQNFLDGSFLDAVYISSNPNPAEEANAEFASVEEDCESGWDES